MGLIKITILVWIIFYVYKSIVTAYLNNNISEAINYMNSSYMPIYKILVAILNLVRFILLIASAVWFLFFR